MFNLKFLYKTFWKALCGIPVTLEITIISLIVGIAIGVLIALARIHRIKIINQLCVFYVSFVRGTPVVIQILLVYSLVPSVLNVIFQSFKVDIKVFEVNPIWYALLVFSLNMSAHFSEVFRSALLTVNSGQKEAALTIGLTTFQAYKRIILPQAYAVALPQICNATVGLIKNTSLAFLMGIKDITAVASIEASYGYNYIEAYLDIFFIYIIICLLIQKIFSELEKKASIYRRK